MFTLQVLKKKAAEAAAFNYMKSLRHFRLFRIMNSSYASLNASG